MVDEEFDVDSGQSAFWETQAEVQAPPPTEESPAAKKKKLLIGGMSGLLLLLLLAVIFSPKQQAIYIRPTPKPSTSPTPMPLQSGVEAEFVLIDEQLNWAALDQMVPPPQTDMQVEF